MIAPTTQPERDRTEGERRKRAELATLEARRRVFVNRGRRALLEALLERGVADADDVRRAVELPEGVNPVCLGSVPGLLARAGIIERAGFTCTNRAAAHARPVTRWRLADRLGALAWLEANPDTPDPAPAAAEGGRGV